MFRESLKIGSYTLIRKLGQGGFGAVWLAEDADGGQVAVKLPHKDQVDWQHITQEIGLWTLCGKHKNVLPLIGARNFNGQIAIISEYAPGGSIEDLLNGKGSLAASLKKQEKLTVVRKLVNQLGQEIEICKLSVEEAVGMTVGILEGLQHLHESGIIHRDLKPDNILLDGKTPRLTDFGISRVISENSLSRTVAGTLAYMALECFDGRRNAQTDIWSVGVILYRMLTGKLPFAQKTQVELVGALAMKEPEPLPDNTPNAVQKIVMRALTKEPAERYQTAEEMAEDLRQFLPEDAQPTPSNVVPPPDPSPIIVEPVSANPNSVVTELKAPVETDKAQRKVRSVSSPEEARTNRLYLAIPAVVLILFAFIGGSYWLTSSNSNQTLIPFRKGDKWGFSDVNKKIIIEPKYDFAQPFSEGLAAVKLNDKFGYIDKTGKEVIPLKYDGVSPFKEGLAIVFIESSSDRKMGFINNLGVELVPLIYSFDLIAVEEFYFSDNTEELINVKLNAKYGFIDKAGREIVPFKYDWASGFSEGLAKVGSNNKFGFIDKTGNEVIPLKYDSALSFSGGFARIELNGKVGFINKNGEMVIPLNYEKKSGDDISFSEGLASVFQNGKCGFINEKGSTVIPFKYETCYAFSEGLAAVELNEKFGFINIRDEMVITPKYELAGSFSKGLARVKLNDKIGFINKDGKLAIPVKYDWGGFLTLADDFSDKMSGLTMMKLNGKEFYIDKNGTEYYEP
jgi:serine/threonine protein kinase